MRKPTDSERRYFYKVALSLVLAAQFFRLLPDDSFDVIANVISAVFAVSTPALAIPNTPKRND